MIDDPTDRDDMDGDDEALFDDEGEAEGTGVAVGDMSPRDFARLGLNRIAYVRAVREPEADPDESAEDDEPAPTRWAIHAANGQRIGMAPTPELAFAATRQHDMEPVSVH